MLSDHETMKLSENFRGQKKNFSGESSGLEAEIPQKSTLTNLHIL